MTQRVAGLAGLTFLAAALTSAQIPTEFEVASVRRNTANDRIVTIDVGPGGRFAARGYTLVLLIQRAYGVMDWNVTGGPGWIRSDRFDVVAKANVPGNLTEAQLQPMLQALLADRFKLKLHRSSKQMAGHALEVAKGGPKVQPSAAATEEQRDSFRMTATGIRAQAISMPTFARFLAGKLGLIGVDETGLSGLYDFKLDWPVEAVDSASEASGADRREALQSVVLAAMPAQLGLKLAPKKITVQMLVIDNAEKASAADN